MARVAIIGAGQLGMMLGAAGRELGVDCVFLDPSQAPPAARVGTVIRAAYDDADALAQLADGADALTYEFENVPVAALGALPPELPVRPPPAALAEAQDRAREKRLFERLGIPLPRWRSVDGPADLRAAARDVGLPLVLKTRRFGYDGKGQAVVRSEADFDSALERLPRRPLVAEALVPFDREVSAIGVRGANGATAFYPLTENVHRGGILHTSVAPVGPEALAAAARDYCGRLLEALDYVGVLALELFVVGDTLLANEFAPRVHNSGHWTIEGAATSQFANHLRAVLGMPLGDTSATADAGMLNIVGTLPDAAGALSATGATLHDYGKSARPGRKLAHATVLGASGRERDRRLAQLAELLHARPAARPVSPKPGGE